LLNKRIKLPAGMVADACHPSYWGRVNRRISVQAGPSRKVRLYLKNNKSKRVGGMAQTVERLEFKPQYYQKKKKRKEKNKTSHVG
jgi:hypothetical protein